MTPVNCLRCGRFVGPDGRHYIEEDDYGVVTSYDAECARCKEPSEPVPRVYPPYGAFDTTASEGSGPRD